LLEFLWKYEELMYKFEVDSYLFGFLEKKDIHILIEKRKEKRKKKKKKKGKKTFRRIMNQTK